MEHPDYEKILEALFEMYERFGLTGDNRAEEPADEHHIGLTFVPYKFESKKINDEARDRMREKIAKFLLSLKVESDNNWFTICVNEDIMSGWEPNLENQSIRLTYQKETKDGSYEESYEYQAQQ